MGVLDRLATQETHFLPQNVLGAQVAPPTTFNAHLRLAPSGQYVLFLRGTTPMPSPANWTESACAGVSDAEWRAMVAKGPYISSEKLQDPVGNFVATATSMGHEAGLEVLW